MVTGQGYGLGIGGCKRLCRRGRGAQLGYTAFPVWSIKDRSLHKALGRSQTYYLEHILVYGHLEDLLLSCRGSSSFWTDYQGFILGGGGLCIALSPGLRGRGLESQFGWGSGPRNRRVVGWFCLCLGYKQGVCFQGTQLGALIHESSAFRYELSKLQHYSKN